MNSDHLRKEFWSEFSFFFAVKTQFILSRIFGMAFSVTVQYLRRTVEFERSSISQVQANCFFIETNLKFWKKQFCAGKNKG